MAALLEQLQLDVPWLDVPEHLARCSTAQVQAFFDTDGAEVPEPPTAEPATVVQSPTQGVDPSAVAATAQLAGCVFLHGSGDTGDGIRQWAKSVAPELLTDERIRFVFPSAPLRPYSLFGGAPSTVWFDRDELHPRAKEDLTGLHQSIAIVHQHVDELCASGIQEKNIFIVGFSQGGCLALHAGLRRPTIGGVFCMSSFLASGSSAYDYAKQVSSSGAPAGWMVLTHGLHDLMVSSQWGEETASILTKCGVTSMFESHAGQHELTSAGLQLMHKWIIKRTNCSEGVAEVPDGPPEERGTPSADTAAVMSISDRPPRHCSSCGGVESAVRQLKRCACRGARYCSKQCQRDDWRTHKAEHNALTAADEGEASMKITAAALDEGGVTPAEHVARVLASEHEFECLQLQVHQTPTTVIRAAYKRLSLAVHPDKNSDARAGEAFGKLFNAVQQLIHYQVCFQLYVRYLTLWCGMY